MEHLRYAVFLPFLAYVCEFTLSQPFMIPYSSYPARMNLHTLIESFVQQRDKGVSDKMDVLREGPQKRRQFWKQELHASQLSVLIFVVTLWVLRFREISLILRITMSAR